MTNYIYKKDRLKMTSLTIVFDAGSELETDGYYGTMHLMEHLICKSFEHLYPKLTANGIVWNAFTSEEHIVVWFEGLSSRLTSDLKIELVKLITGGINVEEFVFDNEKSVVHQEYLDCVNDNTYACELNLFRKYFNDFMPIGNEQDILNFSFDDMHKQYETHFTKPVRIVEIGPDKTPELEEFCKDVQISKEHKKPKFGRYKNELLEANTELKVPVYMVSSKIVSKSDYPFVNIGLKMLTSGLESPFYQKLRVESGLSYYVSGSVIKNVCGGILSVATCTNTERAEELCDKMRELSDDIYKYLEPGRFEDIVNSINVQREKEKILKYEYTSKYAGLSCLKMPNKLDKVTFDKTIYLMSRYFADIKIIRCDKL